MSPPHDLRSRPSLSVSSFLHEIASAIPEEMFPEAHAVVENYARTLTLVPAVTRSWNSLWNERLPAHLQNYRREIEDSIFDGNGLPTIPDPFSPACRGIIAAAAADVLRTAEFLFGAEQVFLSVKDIGNPRSEASISRLIDDYRLLEKLDPPTRIVLWPDILRALRKSCCPLPEDSMESYESFVERLSRYGERFPERVRSLRTACTLMANRDGYDFVDSELPIAVVVEASYDHNGALSVSNGFPLLDHLVASKRFNVVYVEADDENDIRRSLEEVHRETGRRIHSLVTGGHGIPTAIALGAEDPASSSGEGVSEEAFLTTADFRAGEFDFLDEVMEPDGQVVLLACYGGAGENHAFNMANAYADVLRGRPVYSVQITSNIWNLDIREDLSFKVGWTAGSDESYVAMIPADAPEDLEYLPPQNPPGGNNPLARASNNG